MRPPKLHHTLAALLILGHSCMVQSQIYRHTNDNGEVSFSDHPGADDEEVILPETNTVSPPAAQPGPAFPEPPQAAVPAEFHYQSLSITNPENDSSPESANGSMTITVDLRPKLQPSHQLQLLVDGSPRLSSTTTTFNIENVDRGSHQLQVVVSDANGNPLIRSGTITVHVFRPSVRLPHY